MRQKIGRKVEIERKYEQKREAIRENEEWIIDQPSFASGFEAMK